MAQQGQRLTVARWPRRRAHHGGAAGREEENDEWRVHGEIKRLELASWVRKELAELGHASLRWHRRWFNGEGSTENGGGGGRKQRRGKNDDDGASVQITRLRSSRKLRCGLHRASVTPKMATTAPGSKPKIAGHVASAVDTVHPNYRIAIRQNSQITLKFS